MKNIINLRIDVSKIDKKRLFTGQKGIYLDCVLIPKEKNEYGDYMIVESITKEERKSGRQGTILGNAKTMINESAPVDKRDNNTQTTNDLPF